MDEDKFLYNFRKRKNTRTYSTTLFTKNNYRHFSNKRFIPVNWLKQIKSNFQDPNEFLFFLINYAGLYDKVSKVQTKKRVLAVEGISNSRQNYPTFKPNN